MVLRIKGKDDEDVIELRKDEDIVAVKINGIIIARFWDDGKIKFFGQRGSPKYTGDWKD